MAVTRVPKTKELLSISCTSSTFCVGAGYAFALTYNGTTWKPAKLDRKTSLTSVSCPSATFCALVAMPTGEVSTFDGGEWGPPETIDGAALRDVSCPTSTFCSVLDTRGFVLNLHRAP